MGQLRKQVGADSQPCSTEVGRVQIVLDEKRVVHGLSQLAKAPAVGCAEALLLLGWLLGLGLLLLVLVLRLLLIARWFG